MKYSLLSIAVILSLSGCANFRTEYLGNRVTCTVAKDKAYVTSIWGWLGISSEIVTKDTVVICGAPQQEEGK